MVDTLAIGLGLFLTATAVALHFSRGTGWTPNEDISDEVLEQRAATVPETEFPEPMNRSIGGGGVAVSAAAVEGEGGAELEEAEEDDDSWDPADIAEEDVVYYEIEFSKEGETIEVANNETILEAGEDEGWDLPYACRQGQCLSCAGRVTQGPSTEYLRHSNNEMLGDEELDDGYTLTCVAYPTSEFTIETSETP
jgi:2Fe-2S type ferredoxin